MPNLLDVAQRNLFRQRHDYVPAIRNCCLAILVALLLFLTQRHLAFGVMAVVPLFVKQRHRRSYLPASQSYSCWTLPFFHPWRSVTPRASEERHRVKGDLRGFSPTSNKISP